MLVLALTPYALMASVPDVIQASLNGNEVYRLRIVNTSLGAVQISTDKGASWMLIGRVLIPATGTAPGGNETGGTVLRTSPYGSAINLGGGRILRILPDTRAKQHSPANLYLNVPYTAALVKDFLPPPGSKVLWSKLIQELPKPLPPGYTPHDGDVLTLIAEQSAIPHSRIEAYAKDAARYYQAQALARLRATGRKPVTGTLTVTARLAKDEHPFSVSFLVDGETRGIMNQAPFTMSWDTRTWEDGEHLLEVDALDEHGHVTSRSKTLVVIQNRVSE